MGTDSQNRYAAPHVWNLVAKMIREEKEIWKGVKTLPVDSKDNRVGPLRNGMVDASIAALDKLAISFADRFQEKDEGFDRESFLLSCDPVYVAMREAAQGHQFHRDNDPNPGNVEE